MISIKNLNKAFGSNAIFKNLNLEIREGEILGIVGRSGCGKSTLVRCINGLESVDKGEITINDKNILKMKDKELRNFRKNIGMVFQQFSLIERKNVFDNVGLPLVCWNYSKDDIEKKVLEKLEVVGLTHKVFERASNLSGGEKQRVAIARALVLDPNILFCDEATSALDPKTTLDILNLLNEINRSTDITIVMVTHEMDVVKRTCDRVAILNNYNLNNIGDVDEIFLKNSRLLDHLLGQSNSNDISYSKGKCYLDLFFAEDDKGFLSRLSKENNITFNVMEANKETYKDKAVLHIVIEYDEEDNNILREILNKNDIDFLEREVLNEKVRI